MKASEALGIAEKVTSEKDIDSWMEEFYKDIRKSAEAGRTYLGKGFVNCGPTDFQSKLIIARLRENGYTAEKYAQSFDIRW